MVGPAELARLVGISAALLRREPTEEHRRIVQEIASAADARDVSPALAVAVCMAESGLRPSARYLCGVLGGPYASNQPIAVAFALDRGLSMCSSVPSVRRAVYRFRVGRCSPTGRQLRLAQRYFARVDRIARRLAAPGTTARASSSTASRPPP